MAGFETKNLYWNLDQKEVLSPPQISQEEIAEFLNRLYKNEILASKKNFTAEKRNSKAQQKHYKKYY